MTSKKAKRPNLTHEVADIICKAVRRDEWKQPWQTNTNCVERMRSFHKDKKENIEVGKNDIKED
jgi:hypothetical protein